MRTVVMSDIHGFFDEFLQLLDKVKYQPGADKLFILGDYVDKGKKSKETVRYVMKLSKEENVEVIGGNHDDAFLNWLDNNDFKKNPYTGDRVAGATTVRSFCPFFEPGLNDNFVREWIKENYCEEIRFIRGLPYYIEDESHIFVHAGINPEEKNWKNTTKKDFRWIRERFYREPNPHSKTVVFGHTACSRLHDNERNQNVWFSDGKIGIDGGIKFGGQLNALIIHRNGEYETKFVR